MGSNWVALGLCLCLQQLAERLVIAKHCRLRPEKAYIVRTAGGLAITNSNACRDVGRSQAAWAKSDRTPHLVHERDTGRENEAAEEARLLFGDNPWMEWMSVDSSRPCPRRSFACPIHPIEPIPLPAYSTTP